MLVLAAAALVLMVSGQDELNPGECNSPLGLSDGSIGDGQLSSLSGEDSRPSSGRLNNAEGAWCFSNTSIATNTSVLSLELPERRFVTGFATQGPPEKLYPSTYHHVVAFFVEHSLDANVWEEFNGGTLFFDTDKNDTIDTITYHTSNTIVLSQYIRISISMLVSGFPEICLRFELYGCNTDIQPQTQLQAMTTPNGKIEVNWSPPFADTSLEDEGFSRALLRPRGYVVRYRPEGSSSALSAATADRNLTLEDVRLGATYGIKLECLVKDVVVDCGVVRVEAYPPCPEDWTGGNEYHCFLFLTDTGSFEDAKDSCLALDIADSLGKLSNLVDDSESEFLASRIISEDVTQLWLIGEACEENDDCCRVLRKEGDVFKQFNCEDEILSSAVCLRDHKGEGSKLRINVVEAFEDGTSVRVKWRYEGIGWKTDKLQTKLWTDTTEGNPVTSTFSTLNDFFIMADLQSETMYSILLRPAPNIRSDELTYKFIIVDYSKDGGGYGAILTPISMSLYVIWSGTLKVKWATASTYSTSGNIKDASKYSITYEKVSSGDDKKQVTEVSNREFLLTPLEVKVKYQFSLECYFADKFHPCGSASIRTDPPDSFNRDESLVFTIYEWFDDSHKNWFEAESDCQERVGHLTSILNQEEGTTLLNILPSSDAKAWTGAKLVRNGTNLWTDGHGMSYLPMAKNSGMTHGKECCRALNAFGKFRLEGGKCSDNLPYVCKYLVKDILHPVDVTAGWQKWDSFEVAWKLPQKGWLPTEYKVTVCEEGEGECIEENGLKKLKFVADGLKEFTPYEVLVSGSFEPIPEYTAQTKKRIFTYPRKAVREDISTTGEVSLATPMLIAMGKKNAQLTATISRAGETSFTKSGDVEKIEFSKLSPEEAYEVLVVEKKGEWKHKVTLEAVPSCDKSDVRVGTKCFSLVKEAADFPKAVELCSTRRQSAATLEQKLWTSNDLEMLRSVVQEIGYQSPVWMEKPSDSSIIAPDETCSTNSPNSKCCSYSISNHKVLCSNCCSEKQAFVCAYETAANLGQVGDLNPTEIGNKTLGVQWSHPEGISWNIKRYEVNWFSTEKDPSSDAAKTKVVEGQTSVLLDGLEFGTEYHIGVLPLGSKRMKGKELRITLSTLEPRSSLVVTVEPNGVAYVTSPILVEKGRGAEEVTVEVLHADTKKPLVVMQSTAGKAEITGLEPGLEYYVEMKTNNAKRSFKFNTTFKALPSCGKDQIQAGMVCVWPGGEKTVNPREAAEVCSSEDGRLLDYRSQRQLSPQAKARLAAHVSTKFWIDMAGEKTSAPMVDDTKGECSTMKDSDVVCCTFEVDSNEELNDLKCDCCEGPRPFACMSQAKIDLGSIGQITVSNLTSTELGLEWTLETGDSSWKPPSFLVSWSEGGGRAKREAGGQQMVVKKPEVAIQELKPGTSYQVTVAPYTDASQIQGTAKDITIRTTDAVTVTGISDSGCTMVILKISCCITVILGTLFTVFVYIATKMLYIDCLAQLLSELALLGAYLNILVSSAQSYSIDTECTRAGPSLCIAVAALIQFFFQAVFLLMTLEAMLLATALKDYLPLCIGSMTPLTLLVVGFGIPGLLNIILAAIASDGYSDKNDNCWLDLKGKAMLPSVLPVIIFSVFALFLLLSVFDADEPKENLPPDLAIRGRVYIKSRWACFIILVMTVVCYSTGMVGASNRDSTLNYVFIGFSTALGILIPVIRIRCDDQVREQLKRGLFANFRDESIRVTPAPNFSSKPIPLLPPSSELKFKQKQLSDLAHKRQKAQDEDGMVWHH